MDTAMQQVAAMEILMMLVPYRQAFIKMMQAMKRERNRGRKTCPCLH
jgi:hypothetical protein